MPVPATIVCHATARGCSGICPRPSDLALALLSKHLGVANRAASAGMHLNSASHPLKQRVLLDHSLPIDFTRRAVWPVFMIQCRHVARTQLPATTLYESTGPVELRCRLKNDSATMIQMNMNQSDVGGSVLEIGYRCPYAENGSYPACAWFAKA